MRILPLLSSLGDPTAWEAFRDVELDWKESAHHGWESVVRAGVGVHALHFSPKPWDQALLSSVVMAARPSLQPDFLVIPTRSPRDRMERSGFLGTLEALLEALQGRGIKLALKPDAASVTPLVELMKEVRCDAVGYCWHEALGESLESIADRLYCAVGSPSADLRGLRRLGYRWNLAIPSDDPRKAAEEIGGLESRHPMVYFPEVTR